MLHTAAACRMSTNHHALLCDAPWGEVHVCQFPEAHELIQSQFPSTQQQDECKRHVKPSAMHHRCNGDAASNFIASATADATDPAAAASSFNFCHFSSMHHIMHAT